MMEGKKSKLNLSKARRWRRTLDSLLEESGRDLKWLCDYTGMTYNENGVSFYEKLPKKRVTYIAIGMALNQPLDVINKWITDFAEKRRLYIKDVSEDLIWIYLIGLNLEHPDTGINYYRKYEECQSVAYAAYCEVWQAAVTDSLSTADLEVKLDKEEHDQDFKGLTRFISRNIDSFSSAYARPREYMNNYLSSIFWAKYSGGDSKFTNLSSLRGYLDDAMINFLSGDYTTINTFDRTTRRRSMRIKYIPKGRKFHISLCLALGMTVDEINCYLDLMGFAPLQEDDKTEGLLIELLHDWDVTHPFQRAYKEILLSADTERAEAETASSLIANTAFQEELLFLREEMYNRFKARGAAYPYLEK